MSSFAYRMKRLVRGPRRGADSTDGLHALSAGERYDLFASVTDEIVLFSDQGSLRILDANEAALRAYGYRREEMLQITIADLRAPATRSALPEQVDDTQRERGTLFETEHIRKDGSTFPVEVLARSAPVGKGRIIVSTIRDISERRKAAHHVERLTELWRFAMEPYRSEEAQLLEILRVGAAEIIPNGRFVGRLSHVEADTVIVDAVVGSDGARDARDEVENRRATLRDSIEERILRMRRAVGWSAPEGNRTISVIGVALGVGAERYVLSFSSSEPDVPPFSAADEAFVEVLGSFIASRLSQSRLRDQLVHAINHDRLTGLPNRAGLRQAANKLFTRGLRATIALIDLDGFHEINESLGHMSGDALMVEVGAALLAHASAGDFIARLDGDTFGVLMPGTDDEPETERIAGWRRIFHRPFGLGDRDRTAFARVTAGFGIAAFPRDGGTFEQVMTSANAALQAAKRKGAGQIASFDDEIASGMTSRTALRAALSTALDQDQFEMYYQPTVDLSTFQITGAEALVRWKHPQRGLIGPDQFIPFSQRDGSIRQIDRRIAARVSSQIASLSSLPYDFRCFINLSATTLDDPEIIEWLTGVVERTPAVRGKLGIEVTENAAMQHVERTLEVLAQLRALDFRIAIDDFGTGYSSLAYLKRFPIDVIKIDRSFVDGIVREQADRALIETLLGIAVQFKCATVAEGVETLEQVSWLRATSCTSIQGFYIAQPMPFAEYRDFLRDYRASVPPAPEEGALQS